MQNQIMKRMKENYENRSQTSLTRRIPVIIRLDGKAFHTYTRDLDKPFDAGLIEDMQKTAIFLCQNIQGAKLAYTQSDEISILVTDYDKLTTDAWFGYNIQKMVSVSASLATAEFNRLRYRRYLKELEEYTFVNCPSLAFFDSRVFTIPKEEVANYFLARQQDAVRNSIHMAARSVLSHKECDGKNSNELQELMFKTSGINWNDYTSAEKRGSTIVKNTYWNDKLVNFNPMFPLGVTSEMFKVSDNVYGNKYNEDRSVNKVEAPTVRTKWECVRTPYTFKHDYFSTWLNKS